ncbi:hypothetical protein BDF20DRAFT_825394 [Mycotypha africana]|uniref:uncharacterized protein n=1 Tax=Mycotypha africana TaxID=64632 RepID=UPI0023007709|nr:uncharacterized protein BDF20DRAFT_825394 [Mycotypha africana]KAI8971630.1 hypothetical protein BDF20DRAFT_825394 [Mycotypha africana]
MLLYGEFGFLLLNLKPAMLIDFRDAKINQLYLETVVQPVMHALKSETAITLDQYIVKDDLRTPESHLNGCIFVYHTKKRNLLLPIFEAQENSIIFEETMAMVLDYPGHLPKDERDIPTMISVIYLHERAKNKGTVALTTFAIQQSEKEVTLKHFNKYKELCKRELDIELKLHMQ